MPKKKGKSVSLARKLRLKRANKKESLLIIDRFSHADLQKWEGHKDRVLNYQAEFYAVLSRQRSEIYSDLKQALLNVCSSETTIEKWQRTVHIKYCNNPLSAKGSLLNDPGGRFNIGSIDETRFESFPALYLAHDKETSFLEAFAENDLKHALEKSQNFGSFDVEVAVRVCLDLSKSDVLQSFSDLINNFLLPKHLEELAKEIGFEIPTLARDLETLYKTILDPNWRRNPMQFDIPANCQILGRIAFDAGIEAIKYPSCKNGKTCLVVFPANLDTGSYVRILGETQETLKYKELSEANHLEVIDS